MKTNPKLALKLHLFFRSPTPSSQVQGMPSGNLQLNLGHIISCSWNRTFQKSSGTLTELYYYLLPPDEYTRKKPSCFKNSIKFCTHAMWGQWQRDVAVLTFAYHVIRTSSVEKQKNNILWGHSSGDVLPVHAVFYGVLSRTKVVSCILLGPCCNFYSSPLKGQRTVWWTDGQPWWFFLGYRR